MSAITTTTPDEKQAALHAVVLAKLAYWDALAVIERMYCPDDDVADQQSDQLVQLVDNLAAGYPGIDSTPNPAAITTEHVEDMDRIFA